MYKRKIEPEKKIEAVEAYQRGEVSAREIIKRLKISKAAFQAWVRNYNTFGRSGLLDKVKAKHYPKEVKIAAVQEYLSENTSLAAVCQKYKIYSSKPLRDWIKRYNGHKELRDSKIQRSDMYMTKGRNTAYEERVEIVSYCIENGTDYAATVEKYGVSYQQIYSWVRKYKKNGAEGLQDKRGKRKDESEMTELEKLRAENRLLEAHNKHLEMENAVLKKLEELERG